MSTSRRDFLAGTLGGWLANQVTPEQVGMRGRVMGASHRIGHLLRDADLTASPTRRETCDVLVVGGGISGLSASWRLAEKALDVRIVDLEPFVGGTSTWGEDGAVPHPFGAHYLPAPNLEARAALKLLGEMGVLLHFDAAGRPVFDPKRLCHAPQERLFYRGQWHPGLVPHDALEDRDIDELDRFEKLMDDLEKKRGADGRYLFQIPVDLSSNDPENLALDRMSFADWLSQNGFTSPFLRWYARYATLDDFGGEPENVSAWAGIHYFTSRKEESEALSGSRFLVWPEGNGALARALHESSNARFDTGALCLDIRETEGFVEARIWDAASREIRQVTARGCVVATPAFIAKRMLPRAAALLPARAAAPWVVANVHVDDVLDPNRPWDNVLFDSVGLGYVDASHQITPPSRQTVLTYFRAYGDSDVQAVRRGLLAASWAELASGALHDLAPAHPDLVERTSRIDVMVWGHAMPRPVPGFLGERPFQPQRRIGQRIAFGHVDLPGMALFEEAQRAGVLAAEAVLEAMGLGGSESWA